MTGKTGAMTSKKPLKLDRSLARLGAVQALYQMDIGGADTEKVLAEFELHHIRIGENDEVTSDPDIQFFRELVLGVVENQTDIDPKIDTHLAAGWRLNRLDSTLRAILRAGTFELGWRADIPVKVVLDEYIELAHDFFQDEESKVVNGVLDALAKELRTQELSA